MKHVCIEYTEMLQKDVLQHSLRTVTKKQGRMKNLLFSYPVKFCALLLLTGSMLMSCEKKETKETPVCKAIKGTLYFDVFESGSIQAITSTNISSPAIPWRYGAAKISQIVKDGSEVKAGDTLLVFDPSEIKKAIIDAETRLEISNAELERMRAEHQSSLEEMNADLEVARLSQEISKIQFESAGYEADIKRKEIKLNLEKANIALDRAKTQIANLKKIQAEDIKQKLLSIDQDIARLNEASETLERLFLITPGPGIAIIKKNWSSGNNYQVGDQCWSGSTLIQLPDMSKLKATVQINEVDISKIVKGLKVEIKPDAFSDSLYYGEVLSVANLAINKDQESKIKVFPVDILVKKGGKKLLPGLTVSCRILIDKKDKVVYIPIDAVRTEGIQDYVYLKAKNGFKKVVIETGEANADFVIITKGLKDGDLVALTDPFLKEDPKKTKKK
ncbi:MAG: HlyD family efflux transporter periplasmic adaptor subunit [Bacteroidales bacterium]|nr:HlyD family efflux transporter periplasmic adaptor subunit [Bacteroidales bacterium]